MSATAAIERVYRATFILDPREVNMEVEEVNQKIQQVLTTLGASISSTKPIGSRPLARVTDRKMPNGIYLQYDFTGEPTLPAKIQEKYRLDRSVDRIMVEVMS